MLSVSVGALIFDVSLIIWSSGEFAGFLSPNQLVLDFAAVFGAFFSIIEPSFSHASAVRNTVSHLTSEYLVIHRNLCLTQLSQGSKPWIVCRWAHGVFYSVLHFLGNFPQLHSLVLDWICRTSTPGTTGFVLMWIMFLTPEFNSFLKWSRDPSHVDYLKWLLMSLLPGKTRQENYQNSTTNTCWWSTNQVDRWHLMAATLTAKSRRELSWIYTKA